jgi:hypothetical protein
MHVPENGNRQPAKFMERLGTPLTQIGLSHCELMVRFAIFRVPSRHELRTWQCADGLARTTGRLRAFAFQRQQPVRSGRAIGAKGPRPLQRRNLTLNRARSVRNEAGASTLAWSGVRPRWSQAVRSLRGRTLVAEEQRRASYRRTIARLCSSMRQGERVVFPWFSYRSGS